MPAGMDEKMRQDMLEAASMAVASAAAEKAVAEQKLPKKTPWKIPPPVVRAVVLVQSCLRRKAFYRTFGAAALEDPELRALAPPDPLVATSLYMCRRMRNPKFVNVDVEAKAVAGIAVAKSDVTMDVLANVVWFYEDLIADNHPAMITLRERLQGLVIHAHEVLQKKLEECTTPAEVHAEVEYSRKTFRVLPELASDVFSCAEPRMKEVVHDAEKVIEREIAKCITTLEFEQTAVELERLFGPVETQFREKLNVAHMRRVQYLERELETRWSRPFAGPLPPHSRAAQRYVIELGMVPSVVSFLKEEKNHAAALEAQLEVELHEFQGILKNLAARRKEAKARTLIEDLESKISDATVKLQQCIERALINLGPDNKKVCQKARVLLSMEAHTAVFAMFAETLAEELRSELETNDPAPEAADRRRGIASSIDYALAELNPDHVFQKELREEFGEEIQAAIASRPSPPTGFGLGARPNSPDEPYGEPPADGVTDDKVHDSTRLPSQVPGAVGRSSPEGPAELTKSRELSTEAPGPALAWGTGLLGPSLSGSNDRPDDGIIRTNERPRSPGEATVDEPEQEDLWFTPVGFEDLKSKDEKVQPKEKFLVPGAFDGPPLQVKEHQMTTASPETVMMMQSFDAESLAKAKEPIHNGITAQLTLEDLTMDVVHLHTEAVFATKFRRAIADACSVPIDRIKIVGFESGSVKVLMTIAEPSPDEQPQAATGGRNRAKQDGPKTAKDVLDDLTKQIADPASRLRLGEIGPYVTSAVLERGVASRSKPVEQHSLATAYMAPPLGTEKPGSRNLAWTGTTQAGETLGRTDGADTTAYPWGNATGYPGSTMPTTQVLAEATSQSPDKQASSMMKSASERTFKTTCPRDPLTHEEQTSSWASPYEAQPMYALYNKKPEEIHPRAFDGADLKTKPKKEKFTMHATFCVTRHPMCGTEKFKGLPAPQSPTIAAANSWLEGTDGQLQEEGMTQADWPDLGDLAEKGRIVLGKEKDGTQSEVGDIDEALSPMSTVELSETKKGRKGRKKKTDAKADKTKSRDLQEPEPEAGMESTASSPKASEAENDKDTTSPASSQPKRPKKGAAKKAEKAPKETTPGDTTDGTVTEYDSALDSAQEGDKKKMKDRAKQSAAKRASAKKELKPVEEGKDPKDSATATARSPRTPSKEKEEKSDNEDNAPSRRRGRLRPPSVNTEKGAGSTPASPQTAVKVSPNGKAAVKGMQRPASEGSREFSMNSDSLSGATNSRYAGMLGGIPNTGVRHQVDGEAGTRLPELVGKPSTDDLRTPAFMYSWFRHSTVGVGPPYRTTEKDHEENPAWTAMRMLDESLDKNDWQRSYAWPSRKVGQAKQEWAFRGAQLGPERSIRQIQLGRSQSLGARDRLPPVNRRGGRNRPPREHGKPPVQIVKHTVPTPKTTVTRPKTPETPEVVITSPDDRPSSTEQPSSPKGGSTVADVIEVEPTPSETTQSESEKPKEQKPKAERRKRNKVELRQREEQETETDAEREARLAAEDAKKAEAKAEQKRKKTEEKNKKAKDRLEKERREKEKHDKEEADRHQHDKEEDEEAERQEDDEKSAKDKKLRDKRKKEEEENIKRNHDKKRRERGEAPDMTGFDPHDLDNTLKRASQDVLDSHGHLDVPENATSRSSSKNSAKDKKGDKDKKAKGKAKKSKASSSNATAPQSPTPSPTSTKEDDNSRPGTSGSVTIEVPDSEEMISGNIAAGLDEVLDSGELEAYLSSCKDENIKREVASALSDSLRSGGLEAMLRSGDLPTVLSSQDDNVKHDAPAALKDSSETGDLAALLSANLAKDDVPSDAPAVPSDAPPVVVPKVKFPVVSGTAVADVIDDIDDVTGPSTEIEKEVPPEEVTSPPQVRKQLSAALEASAEASAILSSVRSTIINDPVESPWRSEEAMSRSVDVPVALPQGSTTPPTLTIKLDFFSEEDRPETRSPSMFSRMDTPTSCNTTLHNFTLGGGERPVTGNTDVLSGFGQTTEMGTQTSRPSSGKRPMTTEVGVGRDASKDLPSIPDESLKDDKPPSGTAVADEIAVDSAEQAEKELPTQKPRPKSPEISVNLGDQVQQPQKPAESEASKSCFSSSLPSTVINDSDEEEAYRITAKVIQQGAAGYADSEQPAQFDGTPFPLSPSVGAWLRRVPDSVNNRLLEIQDIDGGNEIPSGETVSKNQIERFSQRSSVGAWLQDAPQGVLPTLKRLDDEAPQKPSFYIAGGDFRRLSAEAYDTLHRPFKAETTTGSAVADAIEVEAETTTGSAVADAIEVEATPFSPSVGWLESKPARAFLAAALADALKDTPFSHIRALPSSLLDQLHSRFKTKTDEEKPIEPPKEIVDIRPVVDESEVTRSIEAPESTVARPEAKFRTNAGATREQVMNFAQSLTSSIFRTSNSIAMQRAASQPGIRRPTAPAVAPVSNPAPEAGGTRASSFSPPPPRGANASSSREIEGAPTAPAAKVRARPKFEKKLSPIPTEEGAFFD